MEKAKPPRRLFSHPLEALKDGGREELLYVACSPITTVDEPARPDYLATVDVDPESTTYGKVLHRLAMSHVGDEISRLGWNTCMSCYGEDASASHEMLIVTCLKSSRIYAIDVASDPKAPVLKKVIEDDVIRNKSGMTRPRTSHCLGFGKVMISAYEQDATGDHCDKGGFIEFDVENLDVAGRWDSGGEPNVFCHDFWYQLLTHNVIVSTTGWGRPDTFDGSTTIKDAISQASGSRKLHFWNFEKRTVTQSVDLGPAGVAPLAVRFLHDAEQSVGFVASAVGGGIFRFCKNDAELWDAKKVIEIPQANVERLGPDPLPAVTTDIVLSLDDKFLYCCNWLLGDIRQYDVTDTEKPKLVGQVSFRVSGDESTQSDGQSERSVKGRKIQGGPSNMTLSLDGRRLYVTTSLFSRWDAEAYPEIVKNGSSLVLIDVDIESGGLSLNQDFVSEFTREDGVADRVLAKEMRYPGGDCTSDIFLSLCSFTPKKKEEENKD